MRFSLQSLENQIEPLKRQRNDHQQKQADAAAAAERERIERHYQEQRDSIAADVDEFLRVHARACSLLGQIKTRSWEYTKQFAPGGVKADAERLAIANAYVEKLATRPLDNPIGKLTRDGWKNATGMYPRSMEIEVQALVPPAGYRSDKI